MENGMEKNSIRHLYIVGYPNDTVLMDIIDLYVNIFNDADVEFFETRLKENSNSLCVLACSDNKIVGFKIGYPYNENTFYSWIGGVLPKFRQQGIATQLAKTQEDYAKENGFTKLRTKSMNQYKPMIILNLKNGFDITNFYINTKGQTKIVFEKSLI